MKTIRRIFLITASSLLCGGIFYALWLAAFLIIVKNNGTNYETLLWILSPIVTAFGFTLGVLQANRILKKKNSSFLSIYLWPLAGCILGATLIYWYGPMLIVFSMLAVGSLSVFLRETIK